MARRPVNSPYTITTEFGQADSNALYGKHSGVDYAVETGRPIYATISGSIVSAISHPVRGNMVTLFDGQYYHRFMHNSRINVSQGQRVSEGDTIAFAGTTGLSTGPHCHWDINTNGVDTTSFSQFIDPASWLASKNQPSAQPSNPQGGKAVDASDLNYIYQYGPLGRTRGAKEGEDVYLGKTASFVIADHLKSKEYATRQNALNQQKQSTDDMINNLRQQIGDRDNQIKALQSAQPTQGTQATPKQLASEKALDAIKDALSK